MIIPLLVVFVCVGLIAGSGDSSSASGAAGSDGVAVSANGDASGSTGAGAAASEVGKEKPTQVQVPKGPPPTKLEVTDLVEGAGPEAKDGDELTVHYVLLLQKNGKEVESSWGGKPYSFELGGGKVTAGWEQGIAGMKEGGRRELVAPGNLSYGKAGIPPTIGPNEALVSVIDLIEVKEPGATQQP